MATLFKISPDLHKSPADLASGTSRNVVGWPMPNKFVAPLLAVGQIWRFDNIEFAIVRLSKHLAELRGCPSGKVVRRGASELQSIRAIHQLIKEGRARLSGHVDAEEGLLAKAGKGLG